MKPIAHIRTDFPTKFGIPRQSGLVKGLKAKIVFEPEYRNADALRGLDEYNYLWLLWEFSEVKQEKWSPTVRPPRLGGNKKMGVFATRSPFRPNPIGLSSVALERIELSTAEGPVIFVSGADLMDGTPIYDIKPYLPYVDCHTDAVGGFSTAVKDYELQVEIPEKWRRLLSKEEQETLEEVLSQDPRPSYQKDPERIYGFPFAGKEIRFQVKDGTLLVCKIQGTVL